MSRARRVVMTGVWSIAIQMVTALTQLMAVPFFLKAWSDGTYNDWIALTALVSVLQYADGGMQAHVVNLLTLKATQEKWEELRSQLASATLMYSLAMGLALLGTVGICGTLAITHHFEGRALAHDAVAIAGLLGLQVALQLLQGYLGGLYRAFGRADLSQFVVLVTRTALLGGTLAVLVLQRGALVMAAMQLALQVIAIGWLFYDTRRREPRSAISFRGARLREALQLLGPSLMFLFVSVAQGITQSGTLLVLDWLNPAALLTFSTTRVVANVVRQIVGLFTNTMWPELTRIDAQGNREKFALAHRVLVKTTCMVTLPVTAALLFCGNELYFLWTRGRAEPNPWLLRLLLLDVLVAVPSICSSIILYATSRIREISLLNFFSGLAHLALCVVAVKLVGVWGIGLVMLALTLFVSGTLIPRWTLRVVGESWGSYLRGIYAPYALTAAVTIGLTYAVDRVALAELGRVAASMAPWLEHWRVPISERAVAIFLRSAVDGLSAVLCSAVLSWLVLFAAEEREIITKAVRALWRRRVRAPASVVEVAP